MATLLLIVIYISFIGLGIPDSLFGAAWPAIYPDLGVDLSLASVYSVLSSLFSTVSSMLSDRIINRFGTGRVTAVSTALTAAGLLLFAFSGNFWALCLCTIPLGLGAGTVDTALNNYVALHYSAGQMSYLHCFYGVGVAVSPWLLSLTLSNANDWRGGYRLMFFIQLAITAVLVLSLPLWKQTLPKDNAPETALKSVPKRQVLKNKVARSTLLIFFGSCVIESMCLGWGSTWLVSCRGLEPAGAAGMITFYYVGMALGRFLSGVVSRRFTPKQIIAAGETITALAVAALLVPNTTVAGIALFAIGLGNGPVFPNMTHLTPIHFGPEVSQSFIGLQMAAAYIAFMTTPIFFSIVAKTLGVWLFPVVCICAMVLTAISTVVMTHRTKEAAQ